jgi:hypothetical protein
MANVTFVSNPQPAPACYPPDVNALLHTIAEGGGLSGTIPDNSGGGIYVGTIAPASALTNKVWFAIDGAGRPISVRLFYNGNWRPLYSARIGDVKLYFGAFNTVFDSTGKGIAHGSTVTPYDQEGWAVCNGQNGTPNLEGYFPCGASWSGSAWVANPEGTGAVSSGGTRAQVKIGTGNLPAMYVRTGLFGASGAPCGYNLSDGSDSAGPCGLSPSTQVRDVNGNPLGTQTPLPIHLFYAMAYIMFVGYA